jgi:hypothetical protein
MKGEGKEGKMQTNMKGKSLLLKGKNLNPSCFLVPTRYYPGGMEVPE